MAENIYCEYSTGNLVWLAVNYEHDGVEEIIPLLCAITSISINCNKKGKWTKKYRLSVFRNGKTIDYSYDVSFEDAKKYICDAILTEDPNKLFNEITYSPYSYYGLCDYYGCEGED